jgi:hypothetical protein
MILSPTMSHLAGDIEFQSRRSCDIAVLPNALFMEETGRRLPPQRTGTGLSD